MTIAKCFLFLFPALSFPQRLEWAGVYHRSPCALHQWQAPWHFYSFTLSIFGSLALWLFRSLALSHATLFRSFAHFSACIALLGALLFWAHFSFGTSLFCAHHSFPNITLLLASLFKSLARISRVSCLEWIVRVMRASPHNAWRAEPPIVHKCQCSELALVLRSSTGTDLCFKILHKLSKSQKGATVDLDRKLESIIGLCFWERSVKPRWVEGRVVSPATLKLRYRDKYIITMER